jgi:hypothetical protein
MTSPIEQMLDGVEWKQVTTKPENPDSDLPYATHAGLLKIGALELRCYRLNTGMSVFDADDVKRFFGMEVGQ